MTEYQWESDSHKAIAKFLPPSKRKQLRSWHPFRPDLPLSADRSPDESNRWRFTFPATLWSKAP